MSFRKKFKAYKKNRRVDSLYELNKGEVFRFRNGRKTYRISSKAGDGTIRYSSRDGKRYSVKGIKANAPVNRLNSM